MRMGCYLADHIPNAEFLEIAGVDHCDLGNAPKAIDAFGHHGQLTYVNSSQQNTTLCKCCGSGSVANEALTLSLQFHDGSLKNCYC